MNIRLKIIYLEDTTKNTLLYPSDLENIVRTLPIYNASFSHIVIANKAPYYVEASRFNNPGFKEFVGYYDHLGNPMTEQQLKVLKLEHFMGLKD